MKKKNLLKGLLVSFMLLCSAHTWAYGFRTDGIFYNILSEDDLICEVTGRYTDSSNVDAYTGNVVVPETTTYLGKTYSVVAIGDHAFCYCSNLTEVTIPDAVTSIGSCAFYNCSNISAITIPDAVTSIGSHAFYNCSNISAITIPDAVTSIEESTFEYCSSLTEVTIPNFVTNIGQCAFGHCTGLTEVTIPDAVTSIGLSAFVRCIKLTKVTIGSSVTSIGGGAFDRCSSLTEVTIPNSVTSIGSYAFYNCSSLTKVTSLNPKSPTCYSNTFDGASTSTCVLYVPLGATKSYSTAAGWKDFFNIVEIDTSGIDNIVNSEDAIEVARYTVSGQKITASQEGINIVRYSDGTTRKILVQ